MSLILNGVYRFDEFELNPLRCTLLRDGRPVSLSPKAFEVLSCLAQHPGEVISKKQLLETVWPDAFFEEDNLVQHISALRKAFGDRARYIVTVPGQGYQFAALVEEMEPKRVSVQPGEVVVQRVRERTHIVLEEMAPAAEERQTAGIS
jgi:DNA-binding winged helix-turn-helix (wHTH) protein